MIEQNFFPSNFIGRDGFKWWLGQVADPTSSGWEKEATLEEKENCQYYRVKVRILGYHPPSVDLPDKDLPWAHVLIPTGQSGGLNGIGDLHNIQGGETVLGFFMDGDDCQQPVIFGSLYRQTFQKAKILSEDESYSFKPYNPPKSGVNFHLVKRKEDEKKGGKNLATGEESETETPEQPTKNGVPVPGKTKADAAFIQATIDPITTPNPCSSDKKSRIEKFLEEFMNRLRQIQQFQDLYIDPVLQEIVNLDDEIKILAKKIAGVVSGFVIKARDYVLSKIGTQINEYVGSVIPTSLHPVQAAATEPILNTLWCIFENLLGILIDIILEVLYELINNLFDVVQCTVDNFLNSIFNSISGWIDENLSPILDQINDVIGGTLGKVNNIISKALKYAGIVLDILDCDNINCPTPSTWSPGKGPRFTLFDDWGDQLDKLGSSDFGECDNSLICRSRIVFSGGGGSGAIAKLLVNDSDGSIIGADITDGGFGYVDSPFVSVEDNCSGNGGKLIATVKDGKVRDIIVDDSGDGYKDDKDDRRDDDRGNKDLNNLPNAKKKIGYIDDVYIKKTGFNYSSDDTITVLNCDGEPSKLTTMEIVTGPINGIVKVKVKTSELFTGCLPTIQINSLTGEGAVLIPIMRYSGGTPVDPDLTGPITVIDCVKK